MIVADTNLISEIVRPQPSRDVRDWLNRQEKNTLFLPAPVMAELLAGLAYLPDGRRKDSLTEALAWVISLYFDDRVLAFDAPAAEAYAAIMSSARAAGRAIAILDGQIAAIAAVHNATVATRDTAPFLAAGVPTIDPWQSAA